MKRIALAAASAAAAIAGLTACTSSAAPTAAGSSASSTSAGSAASSPTPTHTVSAADCKQSYDAWKQGPGSGVVATLTAVGSATTTSALKTELKKTGPTLAKAARYPLPACADPKGYWLAVLMHVNAAAASTGSPTSLTAAMKDLPQLIRELTAELNQVSAT
jgi:hypothetical protein